MNQYINYLIIFYQPCVTPTEPPVVSPIHSHPQSHPRQMRWISSAPQSSSSARTAWLIGDSRKIIRI